MCARSLAEGRREISRDSLRDGQLSGWDAQKRRCVEPTADEGCRSTRSRRSSWIYKRGNRSQSTRRLTADCNRRRDRSHQPRSCRLAPSDVARLCTARGVGRHVCRCFRPSFLGASLERHPPRARETLQRSTANRKVEQRSVEPPPPTPAVARFALNRATDTKSCANAANRR